MQHQEIKEWEKKEEEIKRHQTNKLKLLENVLIEREREIKDKEQEEIEKLRSKKTEQKNRIIAKIQKHKNKILRKLTKIQNEFIKDNKNDKINQYVDQASKIYANIAREGLSLENMSESFKRHPEALDNYQLYKTLLKTIDKSEVKAQISLDELLKASEIKYFKLEKFHMQQLKKAKEELYGSKDENKNTLENEKYDLNI